MGGEKETGSVSALGCKMMEERVDGGLGGGTLCKASFEHFGK